MIERLLILALVVAVALLVLHVRERRRPRNVRMQSGINVLTGPDCRLCDPLLAALDDAGADYRLWDVTHEHLPLTVRSLPTVLVADRHGDVVLRRAGRAAIVDLGTILDVAGLSARGVWETP
jgi:hypothetical protein